MKNGGFGVRDTLEGADRQSARTRFSMNCRDRPATF
jgi:hypothetical protein